MVASPTGSPRCRRKERTDRIARARLALTNIGAHPVTATIADGALALVEFPIKPPDLWRIS